MQIRRTVQVFSQPKTLNLISSVVKLRFFGGLIVDETGGVLKISAITIMRDWNTAKASPYRELTATAP
jgi:hypothetical protein